MARLADHKILAILANDTLWNQAHGIADLPVLVVDRLRHYFATYKTLPGKPKRVEVLDVYGREKALAVVEAALADYREALGPAHPNDEGHRVNSGGESDKRGHRRARTSR